MAAAPPQADSENHEAMQEDSSFGPDRISTQQESQDPSVGSSQSASKRNRRTALEVAKDKEAELTNKVAFIRSQITALQSQESRTERDVARLAKLQVQLAEKASALEATTRKVALESEKRSIAEQKAKEKEADAGQSGAMTEKGIMQ